MEFWFLKGAHFNTCTINFTSLSSNKTHPYELNGTLVSEKYKYQCFSGSLPNGDYQYCVSIDTYQCIEESSINVTNGMYKHTLCKIIIFIVDIFFRNQPIKE